MVAQLQKRFPDVLEYESRGSAELVVNVSLMGAKFGDEDMAALKPLAEQIVIADFSGTAVTDRSAASIAAMKRLRVLRLMRTKITDATMQALGGLDQLESLNVFGTAVTPAALQVAAHLPKLRHLYAGETKIPADVQVSEALREQTSVLTNAVEIKTHLRLAKIRHATAEALVSSTVTNTKSISGSCLGWSCHNTQRTRHNTKRAQEVVLRNSLLTARPVDATAPRAWIISYRPHRPISHRGISR